MATEREPGWVRPSHRAFKHSFCPLVEALGEVKTMIPLRFTVFGKLKEQEPGERGSLVIRNNEGTLNRDNVKTYYKIIQATHHEQIIELAIQT